MQIRANLANGDMVGHTGDLKATIAACTAVEKAVTVRGPDLKQCLGCKHLVGGLAAVFARQLHVLKHSAQVRSALDLA